MLAVITLHEAEQWTMHKIYAAVLRYKKQLRLISVVFLDDAGPFSAA